MQKLEGIKVVFVDIDGTLTNSQKKVTEKTSNAIRKVVENGIDVIICSGRGNKYTIAKSKNANSSTCTISSNGALIFDYLDNKILYKKPINFQVLSEIIEYIKLNKLGCILNCTNLRYSNNNLKRKMDNGDKKFENLQDIKNECIYQIVIETDNYDVMSNVIEYIKSYSSLRISNYSHSYLNKIKTGVRYYIDVNDSLVNKGNAIKEYLNLFNIKSKEALCFGDHINDTDMFNFCGYKVAMGNANDELKAKADYVTHTNDEDGVAYFLEEYVI